MLQPVPRQQRPKPAPVPSAGDVCGVRAGRQRVCAREPAVAGARSTHVVAGKEAAPHAAGRHGRCCPCGGEHWAVGGTPGGQCGPHQAGTWAVTGKGNKRPAAEVGGAQQGRCRAAAQARLQVSAHAKMPECHPVVTFQHFGTCAKMPKCHPFLTFQHSNISTCWHPEPQHLGACANTHPHCTLHIATFVPLHC